MFQPFPSDTTGGRAMARAARILFETKAQVWKNSCTWRTSSKTGSAAVIGESDRKTLRQSKNIKIEIKRWWTELLAFARRKTPGATTLDFDAYLLWHRALYRTLLGGDGYDQDDADAAACENCFGKGHNNN